LFFHAFFAVWAAVFGFLKNLLPLAAKSRYNRAWKMAYFSKNPAPDRRNPTGKKRVWDFFPLSSKTL
jgi:hypothetical protein